MYAVDCNNKYIKSIEKNKNIDFKTQHTYVFSELNILYV